MNEQLGYLLANAAVEPDGIELDFQGDKCGKRAYRIKKDRIGTFHYWQAFFYDWHDGWLQINGWPGEKRRREAIEICNKHALDKRLINWLPNKPKFKPAAWPYAYSIGTAGAQIGSALGGMFGL